jgi:hypothetical protein
MLLKLRSRLSYANVMATIAVFIALGGTSYAAVSITGRDVRNESLTGRDVRNNSLVGRDLRGISGRDVRNNSLTGADVTRLRRRDFVSGELTPATQIVQTNATVSSMATSSPSRAVPAAKSCLVAASTATSPETWPARSRSGRRTGEYRSSAPHPGSPSRSMQSARTDLKMPPA